MRSRKIRIVGAGPAGMLAAVLLKKRDPAADVVLLEKNPPDATFGWGVVFSDRTMAYLRDADAPLHETITERFARWDNVDVVHRGETVTIRGNHFRGIARLELLRILQRRCREVGADLRFEVEVDDPVALAGEADLLIGADGAGSRVRETFAEAFGPSIETGENPYLWLGTPRLFHGLTLLFRETEHGPFIAHAYKFGPDRSTFIVECPPAVWARAGIEGMSEPQTLATLGTVFEEDLGGAPLLSNDSRWLRFRTVRNRRWRAGNTVLLGDALHTAHFSIGSGTRMAFEDAIALDTALASHREDPDAALDAFESSRRGAVETLQAAAVDSMHWFERVGGLLHLDPTGLAYEAMTRSGRVDSTELAKRDPAFVKRYASSRN